MRRLTVGAQEEHDRGQRRDGQRPPEVDTFRFGFAARKAALTLYLSSEEELPAALLAALGKHKTGKGCLYLRTLSDADPAALDALIGWAYARRACSAAIM